jgi:hypothetical protein
MKGLRSIAPGRLAVKIARAEPDFHQTVGVSRLSRRKSFQPKDSPMSHELSIAPQEFLIVAAYLWFAAQCGAFSRLRSSRAQRAWFSLIAVFVLCAFNGYGLPAALAVFGLPLEALHAAHYWGHWLLVAAAWSLALSSAPVVVAAALARDAAHEAADMKETAQ